MPEEKEELKMDLTNVEKAYAEDHTHGHREFWRAVLDQVRNDPTLDMPVTVKAQTIRVREPEIVIDIVPEEIDNLFEEEVQ
jgi:hypothetical protein